MPLPARNVRTNTTRPPTTKPTPASFAASKASAVIAPHGKGKGRETDVPEEDADLRKQISLAPRAKVSSYPHIATSAASNNNPNPLLQTRIGVSSAPKHSSNTANQKDKADRATVEQVLDSRTRAVLVSLVRKGLVSAVQGCVSTGKEVSRSIS
jgi:RIO kinase 1